MSDQRLHMLDLVDCEAAKRVDVLQQCQSWDNDAANGDQDPVSFDAVQNADVPASGVFDCPNIGHVKFRDAKGIQHFCRHSNPQRIATPRGSSSRRPLHSRNNKYTHNEQVVFRLVRHRFAALPPATAKTLRQQSALASQHSLEFRAGEIRP